MSGESVLVTGGSGFIGSHTILDLLGAGYRVRTTVRSPEREASVRELWAPRAPTRSRSLSPT